LVPTDRPWAWAGPPRSPRTEWRRTGTGP
jgi:hypothetical protein